MSKKAYILDPLQMLMSIRQQLRAVSCDPGSVLDWDVVVWVSDVEGSGQLRPPSLHSALVVAGKWLSLGALRNHRVGDAASTRASTRDGNQARVPITAQATHLEGLPSAESDLSHPDCALLP